MLRRRHDDRRQRGQIMILFAMSLVVIMAFLAIVVDLGVLRNNRQILVDAVDSAALAGGTVMPVDGGDTTVDAQGKTPREVAHDLVVQTIVANYPGLTGSDYTILYACRIGVKPATSEPYVTRDIPSWDVNTTAVCNPGHSLGWTVSTTLAQREAAFTGAGASRSSTCDPFVGDKCNTVVVKGIANTPFSFGRVVGVNSGSTGTISAAACNGPCGAAPALPVDVVLIMDRTGSMSGNGPGTDIGLIQAGASAVLSVFDPNVQRIALGTIGPSAPGTAACPNTFSSWSTQPVLATGMTPSNNVNWFAPADRPKWVPVGFTGMDSGSPTVAFKEAYSSSGLVSTSSNIWKAISCLTSYSVGTNLDTPVSMAQTFLTLFGRAGVKKGIILETDGTPQAGDGSAHYTCDRANAAAAAAKTAGTEIFTIGYGLADSNGNPTAWCPKASGGGSCSSATNANETAGWSCVAATTLMQSMASPDQPGQKHAFIQPAGGDLTTAFTAAALQLAGSGARLVQLYPPPIVTSIAPTGGVKAGGTSVTITGKYFTGANAVGCPVCGVRFGGGALIVPSGVTDTSMTVTSPPGAANAIVHVTVTTPGLTFITPEGLTSLRVPADLFTYGP